MAELVEKELSYKIVGVFFSVYNGLGGGYQEKYYQRAVAKEFQAVGLKFIEQINIPLSFRGSPLGRYLLDFLVEDKVVVEIKASNQFYDRDIKQVLGYLKASNLRLGILARFGRNKLETKRVLKGNN
ncbi:MAG: GxxExxY protein [Candidatus Liptonbacteria bacterium]|nr:GxxExxY protein [Candidatus Liptonbacteria bacterium]